MTEFAARGVAECGRALASGELTSLQLVGECLATIDELDRLTGSVVARNDERALSAAAESDERRSTRRSLSRLDGIPLGVKDIIATAGIPTRAGSAAQDPDEFSDADATAIANLRASGAIILAKTATMEYAMGTPEDTADRIAPRNPWNLEHWTGGSSSGSAAGVAAGYFPGAIGTDTAGSIRLPSNWCGVTGLKPTWGTVSIEGVIPLGVTFDHVGPIARTAEDCSWLMAGMSSPAESTQFDNVIDWGAHSSIEGVRIGVEHELIAECSPEIAEAIESMLESFASLGAELVDVALPHKAAAHAATIAGLTAEAFDYHRDALASRWSSYGADSRQTLASGVVIAAHEYVHLQRLRCLIRAEADELFAHVDFIASPIATTTAPRLDNIDYDELVASFRTTYWNATGHPAVALPAGFSGAGLPIGMQLAGRWHDDARILSVIGIAQSASIHHLQLPTLRSEA